MRIIISTILAILYASLFTPSFIVIPPQTAVSYYEAGYIPKVAPKTPENTTESAKTPIYEQELTTTEQIKEYIGWSSEMIGIDKRCALLLSDIESDFEPHAENPSSTAYGPYQWLKGSFAFYCQSDVNKPSRKDPKENIECAHIQIYSENLRPWLVVTSTRVQLHNQGCYLNNNYR